MSHLPPAHRWTNMMQVALHSLCATHLYCAMPLVLEALGSVWHTGQLLSFTVIYIYISTAAATLYSSSCFYSVSPRSALWHHRGGKAGKVLYCMCTITWWEILFHRSLLWRISYVREGPCKNGFPLRLCARRPRPIKRGHFCKRKSKRSVAMHSRRTWVHSWGSQLGRIVTIEDIWITSFGNSLCQTWEFFA
jgi:hypothetical protein